MKNSWLCCVFLLFLLHVDQGDAVYRRWLKNTDFDNPLNWNVGRAPCGNDRVTIPEDSPVVFLQMNTTLRQLTLPMNGEIILGENIQLGFSQDDSTACPAADGDVEFSAVNPSSWVNPDNWCATTTELADCQPASPVDTENVPCVNDDVIFLRRRSYFVTLGQDLHITLKTLKISGTSFTTNSFGQFVSSPDGQKMFKPTSSGSQSTSVTITRQKCNDVGGCACGNDQGKLQEAICSIRSKQCKRSPCRNPVTPVGACCDLCGVLFNGTRGRGFNLASFKNKLKTFFDQYPNVTTAVSVTGSGFVQVVLKDQNGGDGSSSLALSSLINADIQTDLKNGGHKYALDSVQVTPQSSASTSAHTGGNSAPLKSGSVAGIVIGVIIAIVLAVIVVLIYWRRKRPEMVNWPDWSNFSRTFSRFRNHREPPAGSATPVRTMGRVDFDAGFPNPLYNTQAPFDDGNAQEMDLRSPIEEQPTFDTGGPDSGFNNPLYGATPSGYFSDPTTAVPMEKESGKDSSHI